VAVDLHFHWYVLIGGWVLIALAISQSFRPLFGAAGYAGRRLAPRA
jgi:hypothetical protein